MLRGALMVLIPANGGYGQTNTQRLQVMARDQHLPNVFAHPKRALVINLAGEIVDHDDTQNKPYAIGKLDLTNVKTHQKAECKLRRPDLYGPISYEP